MYETYKSLRFDRRGRVLTVMLDRPEAGNAIDGGMHAELATIFNDIARDENVDVIVLTGAGGRFSVGGDIGWMEDLQASEDAWRRNIEEAKAIVTGMLDLDKPVIGKLRGPAVGLGATLILYCDMVIADDTARIGDPHVKVGLAAGDGGSLLWPLLVGQHRAREFIFLGRILDAERACDLGLINRLVPADALDTVVDELADDLASSATEAIRLTKRAMNLPLKALVYQHLSEQLDLVTISQQTADHREAVAAFKDKRAPRFGQA